MMRGCSLLVVMLVLLPAGGAAGAERAPNVVFILADDLGWADLGCYGGDLHESPRIDALARQGVRFTDAYAAAPVCTPTRAAIMTGKFPARLQMTIWHEASRQPPQDRRLIPPVTVGDLPHREVTIAEALRAAGYATAHVGKWHLGGAGHYPQTQGFDVNVGGTFWGAPSTFFYPYRGLWSRSEEYRYVPHLEWGRDGEYLTDRLTDEALKIIDRWQDRPFFLYLAYHTVHTPIEAKPAHVARFQKKITPRLHHQNPVYAGMVASLDENVGRVLNRLDRLGLAENTIVVFTSDNGGYVNPYHGVTVTNNHPLRSGKGSLYEGGLRVPLVVRWPGVSPAGGVSHEPTASQDFYPTLLEMTGVPGDPAHNAQMDGKSIAGLVRHPKSKLDRDALPFHYPHYYRTTTPVGSLRSGDWKLLEFFEQMRVELYNLKDDPGEKTDLAGLMPERAAKLRRRLHAWRDEVKAQMPAPNPNFTAANN